MGQPGPGGVGMPDAKRRELLYVAGQNVPAATNLLLLQNERLAVLPTILEDTSVVERSAGAFFLDGDGRQRPTPAVPAVPASEYSGARRWGPVHSGYLFIGWPPLLPWRRIR
jgi:hypothetical protein